MASAEDAIDLVTNGSEEMTDEGDEEGSTSSSTATTDDNSDNEEGKSTPSKKKKKKKKKKASAGGQTTDANAPAGEPAGPTKAEADKRFKMVMAGVKSGDDNWVQLQNCKIYAAKTKKLMDALLTNESVTSVDLSQNHIDDDGAAAIAIALLSMTGAPQLISLDLRGNPFTENGLNILEGVQKVRKHLVLKTGAYTEEEEESKEDAKAKDAGKGPMFKKYFQSGNEEMEREVAEADEKKQITDVNAIWDQVASCVHRNHIPALMLHLHHLASMMQQEAEPEASGDDSDAPTPSGRRPIASACLSRGLPTIGKILDMVPRQITLQHATVPHNTLGSHRLWACDILSRLLAIGDEEIDKRLLHSKLLPRLLLLALQHPLSSGLHARAVKVLQCCLESKQCAQLLIPMLAEAGWGLELKEDDGTLAKSLTEQLVDLGTKGVALKVGKRCTVMGLVITLSNSLLDAATSSKQHSSCTAVKEFLHSHDGWKQYANKAGPLHKLLLEQEGDLGGPRVQRPSDEDSSELAELPGAGVMSGHDIMSLLQGMNGMSMMK